jgi:branched-chain amino acid transport system ATP-binding protein
MLTIGRALMTNPRLLVLDEATEGLAPIVRQEIWKAIGQLKKETGMTIILIDKSMAELRQICDKATILERGNTVWTGAMSELTANISQRLIGV